MAKPQCHPSEAVTGWSLNGQTWTIMRRADGVPALEGTTSCPSAALVWWLVCMTAAMAALPAIMWLISRDWLPTGYVTIVCGPLGLLLVSTAIKVVRVRRTLSGLVPFSSLAGRTGLPAETESKLAASGSVRPAYVVNGVPMYDPASLTSMFDLLRPADAPADEHLLRAAANAADGVPDRMLRALPDPPVAGNEPVRPIGACGSNADGATTAGRSTEMVGNVL